MTATWAATPSSRDPVPKHPEMWVPATATPPLDPSRVRTCGLCPRKLRPA